MARPQALQLLRKGSLLVGKVFPRFVETWNWLVGAFDSMVGDEDIDPKGGFIRVDRTNPDRPVLRFNSNKIKGGGDGSVTVTGTDGTSVEGVKSITFMSGDDSNVNVSVSGGNEEGSAVVKIDVYYK